MLTNGKATADVGNWPQPPNHATNTTTSEDFSSRLDPINVVWFYQGNADTVNSLLNNSVSPRWPSCGNGSKQWLFVDDSRHTSGVDDEAWVWASGAQNSNPGDSDGAGYNYARDGTCPNKSEPRYHARHFGRGYQSTDTPPQPPLYNYSMIAVHDERCHDPIPFTDQCGSHHIHSWNDARNQLWYDVSDESWLDASNSFSRQVGNEGWYQGQYHDTVFYLMTVIGGGGGGR